MRILFLSTRRAKPSFRFRVEALRPWFEQAGHACEYAFLPRSAPQRLSLYRRLSEYDVLFVQKRLFNRFELALIRRCSQRLVYDVDDAVMYDGHGRSDRRRQTRFRAIAEAADLVICGNNYLFCEARRWTKHVTVVPTSIDTAMFQQRTTARAADPVTIGWTGSSSTNRYLNDVFPVLARLAGRITLKFLSDSTDDFDFNRLGGVPHTFVPWSQENEVTQAATFDIGLMPLPDNLWSRGKCGFKALQYMALGIPAVCSPVGVNCEIIHDGRNGFLPNSPDVWQHTLERLVEAPELREEIGRAGRSRVERAFSLKQHAAHVVSLVEDVAAASRRSA